MKQANDVLTFWFETLSPSDHFKKSDALDNQIKNEFNALVDHAAAGRLQDWGNTAVTSLAYIILLDQFTRNIYRNSAKAFAADHLALDMAKHAIVSGYDIHIGDPAKQRFFYMPFMHSEELSAQNQSVDLFEKYFGTDKWAIEHRDIIAEFGRFPHRNDVLGRMSTDEEIAFLNNGGFKG